MAAQPFRIGEVVIVVSPKATLPMDSVHIVTSAFREGSTFYVRVDNGNTSYYADRFVHSRQQSIQAACDAYELGLKAKWRDKPPESFNDVEKKLFQNGKQEAALKRKLLKELK